MIRSMRAMLNQDGRVELFSMDGANLLHRWQAYRFARLRSVAEFLLNVISLGKRPPILLRGWPMRWSEWTVLVRDTIAFDVVRRPGGELQVFFVAAFANLKTVRQAAPNSGWTAEQDVASDIADCNATINNLGGADVFVVSRSATLPQRRLRERADGGWDALNITGIPANNPGEPLPLLDSQSGAVRLFYASVSGVPPSAQTRVVLNEGDNFSPSQAVATDFFPLQVLEERAGQPSLLGNNGSWSLHWVRTNAGGAAYQPPLLIADDAFGNACMALNAAGRPEFFLIKRSVTQFQRVFAVSTNAVSPREDFGSSDFAITSLTRFCAVTNGSRIEVYVHTPTSTHVRRQDGSGTFGAWQIVA